MTYARDRARDADVLECREANRPSTRQARADRGGGGRQDMPRYSRRARSL
jgi:hypothetical protein